MMLRQVSRPMKSSAVVRRHDFKLTGSSDAVGAWGMMLGPLPQVSEDPLAHSCQASTSCQCPDRPRAGFIFTTAQEQHTTKHDQAKPASAEPMFSWRAKTACQLEPMTTSLPSPLRLPR